MRTTTGRIGCTEARAASEDRKYFSSRHVMYENNRTEKICFTIKHNSPARERSRSHPNKSQAVFCRLSTARDFIKQNNETCLLWIVVFRSTPSPPLFLQRNVQLHSTNSNWIGAPRSILTIILHSSSRPFHVWYLELSVCHSVRRAPQSSNYSLLRRSAHPNPRQARVHPPVHVPPLQ